MVKREIDWPPPPVKINPEQKILAYRIEKDILTIATKFVIKNAMQLIDKLSVKLSEIENNG